VEAVAIRSTMRHGVGHALNRALRRDRRIERME